MPRTERAALTALASRSAIRQPNMNKYRRFPSRQTRTRYIRLSTQLQWFGVFGASLAEPAAEIRYLDHSNYRMNVSIFERAMGERERERDRARERASERVRQSIYVLPLNANHSAKTVCRIRYTAHDPPIPPIIWPRMRHV